jgi:hypothetical protein
VKVFDNLYFVGEKEYSAWASRHLGRHHHHRPHLRLLGRRPGGGGLRSWGSIRLPSNVLVSHALRPRRSAAFLQDRFNARVVISEADWELLGRASGAWRKPKRDMVATDGQRLT